METWMDGRGFVLIIWEVYPFGNPLVVQNPPELWPTRVEKEPLQMGLSIFNSSSQHGWVRTLVSSCKPGGMIYIYTIPNTQFSKFRFVRWDRIAIEPFWASAQSSCLVIEVCVCEGWQFQPLPAKRRNQFCCFQWIPCSTWFSSQDKRLSWSSDEHCFERRHISSLKPILFHITVGYWIQDTLW